MDDNPVDGIIYYIDSDEDADGDPNGETFLGCELKQGFSATSGDCDDQR